MYKLKVGLRFDLPKKVSAMKPPSKESMKEVPRKLVTVLAETAFPMCMVLVKYVRRFTAIPSVVSLSQASAARIMAAQVQPPEEERRARRPLKSQASGRVSASCLVSGREAICVDLLVCSWDVVEMLRTQCGVFMIIKFDVWRQVFIYRVGVNCVTFLSLIHFIHIDVLCNNPLFFLNTLWMVN